MTISHPDYSSCCDIIKVQVFWIIFKYTYNGINIYHIQGTKQQQQQSWENNWTYIITRKERKEKENCKGNLHALVHTSSWINNANRISESQMTTYLDILRHFSWLILDLTLILTSFHTSTFFLSSPSLCTNSFSLLFCSFFVLSVPNNGKVY